MSLAVGLPSPTLFEGVIGQEAAVATLVGAARSPVHAYLFHGPNASTRAAARAFSAALLCPDGGCGTCRHCRRALAGEHPDQVIVERRGASLSVDEARRLIGIAQRRPLEAARQVLVVPDIHLALRSAPALLKTIEEPPPGTVFIVLAEVLTSELATITSRCIVVEFPPVGLGAVRDVLIAGGVEADRAATIAQASAGDLDRARLLADDPTFLDRVGLWQSVPGRLDGSGSVSGALSRALLEAIEAAVEPLRARQEHELDRLAEEAEQLGERGISGRKEIVDQQNRELRRWRTDELRAGLGVLARTYRDRLVGAFGAGDRLDATRSCERALGLITDAAESLVRNPNETLLLEGLFTRLALIER